MPQNTTLIRFIVDLGRLICTWLQVNILKEANLVPYKAPALQLCKKKSCIFYQLDFPGDSERLYPRGIFVLSGLIALCTEGERSVLVGMVELRTVCLSNKLRGSV